MLNKIKYWIWEKVTMCKLRQAEYIYRKYYWDVERKRQDLIMDINIYRTELGIYT